ncbi:MAG: helix-turn-helix transcriptional regulator [bacterium]|nr:helix-turn-helix transcriptional regulator [bacterium]
MTEDRNLKGTRIKQIRKHLGLNQKVFAKKLAITNSYLSEIESGKKKPGVEVLNKLVEKFQINVSFIFTGVGNFFLKPEENKNPLFSIDKANYKNKCSSEELEILKEMFWYIENISVVRFAMVEYFKFYLYNKKGMIEEEVDIFHKNTGEG